MNYRVVLSVVILLNCTAVFAKADTLIWCLDHLPKRQHYEAGKQPYGPMVDLMQDLAKQLGLQLTYTLPTPTNRCLQQLEQGEVDIVASLLYSAERANRFYLIPFDVARSESWFVHKDNDLSGKSTTTLTLIDGLIYTEGLADSYKAAGYNVNIADGIEAALTALFFRDTDIVIGPEHYLQGQIARNARYKDVLILASQSHQPVIEAHVAISKTGRYADRLDSFRQALQKIRQEGKYQLYN